MRSGKLITSAILLVASLQPAHAGIRVYMDGWDFIPLAIVTVGNNQDCGRNAQVFSGSLRRGQQIGNFPQAGSRGVDVCWKRTADPLNPASGLQQAWTRCSADGDCVIS